MINLIFIILKIIGVIFLTVIVLSIILILMLAIANLNLDFKIKYKDDCTDEFIVEANVAYLFNAIKYSYNNSSSKKNQLKILGIDLSKLDFIKTKKVQIRQKNTNLKYSSKKENYETKPSTLQKEVKELKNEKIKTKKNKKNIKNRIKKQKKIKNNYKADKIKKVNLKQVNEILNLTIKFLKKIIKLIKIKKLDSFIEYGFEDNFLTGVSFGIINMFLPAIPYDLKIVPNFEKECKNVNLHFIAKLNLFKFVIYIIIFIIKKPIRKIIF